MSSNGIQVSLEGVKLGETSWSGAFVIYIDGDPANVVAFKTTMVKVLDHPPWESRYWDEELWETFLKREGLDKDQIVDRLAVVNDAIEACKDRLEHPLDGESQADAVDQVAGRLDALGTILSDTMEQV